MIYFGTAFIAEIEEDDYPEAVINFEIRYAESFDEFYGAEDEETYDGIWANADDEAEVEEAREEAMEILRSLEREGKKVNWDYTSFENER